MLVARACTRSLHEAESYSNSALLVNGATNYECWHQTNHICRPPTKKSNHPRRPMNICRGAPYGARAVTLHARLNHVRGGREGCCAHARDGCRHDMQAWPVGEQLVPRGQLLDPVISGHLPRGEHRASQHQRCAAYPERPHGGGPLEWALELYVRL